MEPPHSDEQLLEAIEYLKTQQSGLMTTMEHKNMLLKGVSEDIQNRFGREVLDLEKTH